MILYKYFSYAAGVAALKSNKLGFRTPDNFNDPFELSFFSNINGHESEVTQLQRSLNNLKKLVVILSLTKTPNNPLMWAYYSQDHTGFVVGYDVDDPFLTSEEYNIITVNQGDVVYTSTKNQYLLNIELMERLQKAYRIGYGIGLNNLGGIEDLAVENLLQKVFLRKHLGWAYEEEVRVVKVLQSYLHSCEEYQSDPYREFSSITCKVAPACCCEVIKGLYLYNKEIKIKEVYLGLRNPLNTAHQKDATSSRNDSSLVDKAIVNNWVIKGMVMDDESWELKPVQLDAASLGMSEKKKGLLNYFSFGADEAIFLKNKFAQIDINKCDNFELTNWSGELNLKKNVEFI